MPYEMRKQDEKWCVFNKDTGDKKGCSETRAMAVKHMRALYAAESGAEMGKKKSAEEVTQEMDLAVKGFFEQNPEEPQFTEDEVKAYYGDSEYYAPYYGATSYSELEAVVDAQEKTNKISDLVYAFPSLAMNAIRNPQVSNKEGAISKLASELAERVKDLTAKELAKEEIADPPQADETQEELKEENIVRRVISRLKELVAQKDDQSDMMIWKEGDVWRWFARYSNNLRDRDRVPEIISAQSHRRFVERVEKGLAPYPELWLWHIPEWKIGQATWLAYDDSGFALAAGHFHKGCEQVAEWLSKQKDVAMSHGMPPKTIQRDASDKTIIIEHESRELSPLPAWAAANEVTGFYSIKESDMAIPADKKKAATSKWGIPEDLLDQIETLNAQDAQVAADKGIESKEKDEADAETEAKPESGKTDSDEETTTETKGEETKAAELQPDLSNYPTRDEIAEAISNVIVPMIKEITDQVIELKERLEVKEKSEKERAEEAVRSTPLASLTDLLNNSAVGNRGTLVKEGDPLADKKPAEKEAPVGATAVPMLNRLIKN